MAALEDLGRAEENNVASLKQPKYCFRSLQGRGVVSLGLNSSGSNPGIILLVLHSVPGGGGDVDSEVPDQCSTVFGYSQLATAICSLFMT
ncbi:hypothetical protein J6590_062985 [Homalodisca vitripennis]|nr:hypothetical protein J6590_062975 [Homalodisca vitripennis]KAG8266850.1 hypothetical protein J6590_062985 [Homalodisca vitripennis]